MKDLPDFTTNLVDWPWKCYNCKMVTDQRKWTWKIDLILYLWDEANGYYYVGYVYNKVARQPDTCTRNHTLGSIWLPIARTEQIIIIVSGWCPMTVIVRPRPFFARFTVGLKGTTYGCVYAAIPGWYSLLDFWFSYLVRQKCWWRECAGSTATGRHAGGLRRKWCDACVSASSRRGNSSTSRETRTTGRYWR